MGSLRRMDDRVLGRLGAVQIVAKIRAHPVGSLMVMAALLIASAVPWFWVVRTIATLGYLVSLLVLALAVLIDMDARDRNGPLWALIVLITGGVAAVLWAFETRQPHEADS